MSQKIRSDLKGYFETGDKPTQAEFANLIDSNFNLIEDTITVSKISDYASDVTARISASSTAHTHVNNLLYFKNGGYIPWTGVSNANLMTITNTTGYTATQISANTFKVNASAQFGSIYSTNARAGVYASSAEGPGVYGYASGSNGYGVYGDGGADSIGGRFISTYNKGLSVSSSYQVGADIYSGYENGVNGTSAYKSGVAGSGATNGVEGYSQNGNGVNGYSLNGNGGNFYSQNDDGIYSWSQLNSGVRGESISSYGVIGTSYDGIGGNFYSEKNSGIYGVAGAYKIAYTDFTAGVYGVNESNDTDQSGVYGKSDFSQTNGVYGSSQYGNGIKGYSLNGTGVYGFGDIRGGVFLSPDGFGSDNQSTNNAGIRAISVHNTGATISSTNGIGATIISTHYTGLIVEGGDSSNTNGIVAITNSVGGYAIYGSGLTFSGGVLGTGIGSAGVRGESTTSQGVIGVSKSSQGLYGSSSGATITAAIFGTNLGSGIGISANALNGTGLKVKSTSGAIAIFNSGTGDTTKVTIDTNGFITTTANKITIQNSNTPATAGAAGTAGQICWDASYIYVCTATNTWKRVAIATW